MIELSPGAVEAVERHGAEAYRDEACGVMYGQVNGEHRVVVEAVPMTNARDDERHRRFIVTPDDYRRAEAEAARRELTLVGFYHSHPDHPAYPSAYDLAHAFPFFSYVILSVAKGEPGVMRSFVLSDDRADFIEETIRIKESVHGG